LAQTLAGRPEARWALWCGAIGGIAGAGLSLRGVFASQGMDAALGYIFVPLLAAACAAAAGIWGAALGHVVLQLRGKVHEPRAVFIAAVMAVLAVPAAVIYELWRR
jgi:hypothetical protein